ncbi:MAG: hypothetical protein EPN82_12050 [Bacteroidetes bacterium]|nr:MAG: hypothetical protein EPN82_12050 [Bacteroidota bacterium]
MKKIINHILEFKRIYLLLLVIGTMFYLLAGCMDTTMPGEANKRILAVNTYVADSANPSDRAPLSGVTVRVYDLDANPNVPIQEATTDNMGIAGFNLQIPLIGRTYRVVAEYNSLSQDSTIVICDDRGVDFVFLKTGCLNVCPRINNNDFGSGGMISDTISNRGDNRVYISPSLQNPSTAIITYDIFNPDTSCSAISFNVTIESAAGVIYENPTQYYTIDPMNFVIQPGQHKQLTITFRAPIKDTLDRVVLRRNTQSKIDSMFAVRLRISTSVNCTQDLDLYSIVTAVPDLSPIINLRAYNQKTPQKPTPEHEVYFFGNASRTINNTGEYPPLKGNIWVDVDDNNPTAIPPLEPILKIVPNTGIIGMKVWRSGFPENDFYNVVQLIANFQNDPTHSSGYTSTELRGIQVGDVIAFQLGPDSYTLIYIRRVDNGTEQTSSKQSGIEFRAISGIYVN